MTHSVPASGTTINTVAANYSGGQISITAAHHAPITSIQENDKLFDRLYPEILDQRIITVREVISIGGIGASMLLNKFAKDNPGVKVSDLCPYSKDETLLTDYIRDKTSQSLSSTSYISGIYDEDIIFFVRSCEEVDEDDEIQYYCVAKYVKETEDVTLYDFETFTALESFILEHRNRICVWANRTAPPSSEIINWDRTGNYELEGFTED